MMSMVRSEFRKVTTTKVLLWLTIATITFSALNVVLLVFLTPRAMEMALRKAPPVLAKCRRQNTV